MESSVPNVAKGKFATASIGAVIWALAQVLVPMTTMVRLIGWLAMVILAVLFVQSLQYEWLSGRRRTMGRVLAVILVVVTASATWSASSQSNQRTVEEIADAVARRQADIAAAIDPRLFTLFGRDPESWPPRRYGAPSFALNEVITPPLDLVVGEARRFNPQLAISPEADSLRRALVFIYFPVEIFATREAVTLPVPLPNGPRWKFTEDRVSRNLIAYLEFGDVGKGYRGSPDQKDVFYLKATAPGPAVIRYDIEGIAERADKALRITRTFTVLAKAITP